MSYFCRISNDSMTVAIRRIRNREVYCKRGCVVVENSQATPADSVQYIGEDIGRGY